MEYQFVQIINSKKIQNFCGPDIKQIKERYKSKIKVKYTSGITCEYNSSIRYHGDALDHVIFIGWTIQFQALM